MHKSQANRALIAARAANRPARASASTVALNPAMRQQTAVKPSGCGIRKHKARMTAAQRNSEGRRSEWNASPYIRDAVATDSKWSQTVRSRNV